MTQTISSPIEEAAEHFKATFKTIRQEVGKFIVGQDDIIENVLISICCGGHVLLEGVPGLGKTALVNTLSQALNLDFQRIQFTPDLLPSDVVGTQVLIEENGHRQLQFQKGPVFCNILLADEINRATPKTQSALLETMQEKRVTVANKTHSIGLPFFVLATQNPIENDGTYALPEAQLDRFFFKLYVTLPNHDDFKEILNRTGGIEQPEIKAVANGEDILKMGHTLRQVAISDEVQDYLVKAVRMTHPENDDSPQEIKQYVRNGASPRAAQSILAAARGRALLDGRFHVAREDVDECAIPAMRHRLILSFEGEAEGILADDLIRKALSAAAK
ncbi:AAA family ATPase [Persicirhabdus sediminis]|uniref:MoxR family ATPase n=1 Tax=Persicirhabdus sediminis TaxID=454144 RepID=A0A8J7MBV8_9BACT|nr:MoxR family ATPase [Persicirhabdus sediminis]MBK1790607.1 MoxR family ATPase [Persicirhabdus sediminis]